MVTEQQSGLRFDIYERVHLSEGVAGIKELDEIELVPHIQVYPENDQAVLRGNLYLTGTYAGEQWGENRTLEHFIPVEITLPMNRIHSLEEVAVEIENFDIDLLSSRSLNVTGVLTLHGIEMISPAEDSWHEEDEAVFVHDMQDKAGNAEDGMRQPDQEGQDLETLAAAPAPEARKPKPAEPIANDEEEAVAEPPETNEVQEVFAEYGGIEPLKGDMLDADSSEAAAEAAEEAAEEKKELKIGFGSKPDDQPAANHFKSLLHKGKHRSEAAAQQPAQAAQDEPDGNKRESLELKRLFARDGVREQQFSRLRICIVQKEETLDGIAKRYNVNPREILLLNRIDGQEIGEGQVLYIPR